MKLMWGKVQFLRAFFICVYIKEKEDKKMGLDMFLYKKDEKGDEQELIRWRNVYPIHQWFVENVQKGLDDCKEYEVDPSDLAKLEDACFEANLKLMPTEPEDYTKAWSYLRATSEKLYKMMETEKDTKFYYISSW